MSTAAPTNATPESSAAGVAWDLADLYAGVDDAGIERDLDTAEARAKAFEAQDRGKGAVPGGPAAAELHAALVELEELCEQMDRPAVYASLLHASSSQDPKRGALLARTRERRTAINTHLIFFDLEWVKV